MRRVSAWIQRKPPEIAAPGVFFWLREGDNLTRLATKPNAWGRPCKTLQRQAVINQSGILRLSLWGH